MFSYLRYFAVISLVIILVGSYLIGVYLRSSGTRELERMILKDSTYISEFYKKSVWNKLMQLRSVKAKVDAQGQRIGWEPKITIYTQNTVVNDALETIDDSNHKPKPSETTTKELTSLEEKLTRATLEGKKELEADLKKLKAAQNLISLFEQENNNFFSSLMLAQVALHRTDRGVFYSLRPVGAELSAKDHRGIALFQQAMQSPVPAFRLRDDVPIYNAQGQAVRGQVMQVFLPLMQRSYEDLKNKSEGRVIGVMQLQFDVSSVANMLALLQYVVTGGIIGLFFLLMGVLFFFMQRAEVIIAKQHELNLELTAAVAAAEAENRDKSQFLANISHELRTPLNAIIGFSEILKNDLSAQLVNQHREYLDDIHGSGKHLLSLINDILDYSKAEAGKLEVDISEIDGIKMVKNSLRLVIPRAEQAQVTLMEDLPTKHFILQTDAKKLKQVLLNLLSNAVKFTPAGGEVRVSCWHNPETDKVTFEIKDTGVGIAQKDIARVMTPFGQADSTLARRFEGTGLGLPLSKKFVEIMGGTFTLTSEVNKGTTVTLVFPRMFDKEAASRVAMASAAPTSI